MASRMGDYDHLGPVKVPLDLDFLAGLLCRENYGVARFLAALVRARRDRHREPDRLMREIERLLNEGEF